MLFIMRGGWPYRLPCVPQRSIAMTGYDKETGYNKECLNCKMYLACDICGMLGDAPEERKKEIQPIESRNFSETTEEEWRKFFLTCE